MLIITRKTGQMLKIVPLDSLDPTTPIGELFRAGPIEVLVGRIEGNQVRIGISAHPGLLIVRDEMEEEKAQNIGRRRGKRAADNR